MPNWEKPDSCPNAATCVETAFLPGEKSDGGAPLVTLLPDGGAEVRSSADPEGAVLVFDAAEWRAFLDSTRGDQYDVNRMAARA